MQETPRVHPVKKDSIVDLLQSSEIEFKTCTKSDTNTIPMQTGFGEGNDLHYDTPCKKPDLKTPLYLENYLTEFTSEEEKAAARHALGLYNKGDVVAMSLLTAEDTIPSQQAWFDVPVKQLRKGDVFFAPVTSFSAVYDSSGKTLETRFDSVQTLLSAQQKELISITQVSQSTSISSLGDVKVFLQGFNNGDNLFTKLDVMDQEMLRFEKTGEIIN